MRLALLTAIAMVAFAANSVLTRIGVGVGGMDPMAFAVVRLLAGAAMLALLVGLRAAATGRSVWPGWAGRLAGVAGLLTYLLGFSWAYLSLQAGAGALILFGSVQITMFAGAVLARERVPLAAWAGAAVAGLGLVVLMWPGADAVPGIGGALAMAAAGAGWGVYSLAGRGAVDALASTAWNFILAVPVLGIVVASLGVGQVTGPGVALAMLSGGLASGLGYALWYVVVPQLGAARAGVAQLTVPVIAAAAGALWIGEAVGWRFALAAALVLGGVALASRQSGLARR